MNRGVLLQGSEFFKPHHLGRCPKIPNGVPVEAGSRIPARLIRISGTAATALAVVRRLRFQN